MKLKDLLKGRGKLRKYDELKEWREYANRGLFVYGLEIKKLPDHIKQIIIDAIDAEIKKMEEE